MCTSAECIWEILKRNLFWSLWNTNTAISNFLCTFHSEKQNKLNLKLLKQQEMSAWNNDDTRSPLISQEYKERIVEKARKKGTKQVQMHSDYIYVIIIIYRRKDYVSSSMTSFVHYILAINGIIRRLNAQRGQQIHFFSFVNDTPSSIIVVNNMSPSFLV